MSSTPEKLTREHEQLIHSEKQRVTSHVQRKDDEWIINTLMIEDCTTPFKFKRKKPYRDLKGKRVNLTYYLDEEIVAGFEHEIMTVVRIRIA